jgi:formate hydrogenlyase transcriptional activator
MVGTLKLQQARGIIHHTRRMNWGSRAPSVTTAMSAIEHIPPESNTQIYEALLRISEELAACREPEELAKILADQLSDFLSFNYLDIVVFKKDSQEIEWQALGKGSLPLPAVADAELPLWQVSNSQEPLHIADWNHDERFPSLKQAIAEVGLDAGRIGSVVRVPLFTPLRRLGTLGIVGAAGVTYSAEDVSFLRLIARVVATAIDTGFSPGHARKAQTWLQHQNERLELLLNLTNRITSNLQLKDALQAITESVRKVMQCRGVAVSLPDRKGDALRLFALDIPGNLKLQTGHQVSMRSTLQAYESGKPVVTKTLDLSCFVDLEPGPFSHPPAEALLDVLTEAGRSFCDVPLIARDRVLGVLTLGRLEESAFGPDEVQFILQAADRSP